MNKTEALNTSLLLRWITGLTRPGDRETRTPDGVLDVALALHERAYAALGAGLPVDKLRQAWPLTSPSELAAEVERLRDLTAGKSGLLPDLIALTEGDENWTWDDCVVCGRSEERRVGKECRSRW